MNGSDQFFTTFKTVVDPASIPHAFELMVDEPHPLCRMAATQLQAYLNTQDEWAHNFGLENHAEGAIIGKMFGVLVVRTEEGDIGYLSAFSGKLANSNHHTGFVPPVFDSLAEDSFLNKGMRNITRITQNIARISLAENMKTEVLKLKQTRKELSISLQEQLYKHYHFLNRAGEEKNLHDLFNAAAYKNPPAGAGECAGPKLLQYAFMHNMQPLALAEFWWGQSPKSATWVHGKFYPCCKEKCGPILAHMLKGVDLLPE